MASPAILGTTAPSIGIYPQKTGGASSMRSPLCSMSARRVPLKVSSAKKKAETSQFAVDTHGYTDFAMSHARLLGF